MRLAYYAEHTASAGKVIDIEGKDHLIRNGNLSDDFVEIGNEAESIEYLKLLCSHKAGSSQILRRVRWSLADYLNRNDDDGEPI